MTTRYLHADKEECFMVICRTGEDIKTFDTVKILIQSQIHILQR